MFQNSRTRLIEWGDCDPAGIVFNPRYFEWFDAATAALFAAALGMPKPEMLRQHGILGIPLVDTRATFRAPCAFGDTVRIDSAVEDLRRSSLDIRHRLWRADGTLAVEGIETRVWAVRDATRPGGLRAAPFPAEVAARLTGAAQPILT
ncbi:acyl-CoA thioesterase [Roseomonas sp. GC11]|uniref:acyl-CoA thioesterase n=1 Tax=Roseomonas sp. GC11 TaxID=2950546 RepID=UPI00210CFD8F|nr:acyl-CoA thioesterase [Roseomonas sp. GC11]MCQ4160032.1 acyl-CoA thioesterase [Roseomonas sp. GC11]